MSIGIIDACFTFSIHHLLDSNASSCSQHFFLLISCALLLTSKISRMDETTGKKMQKIHNLDDVAMFYIHATQFRSFLSI